MVENITMWVNTGNWGMLLLCLVGLVVALYIARFVLGIAVLLLIAAFSMVVGFFAWTMSVISGRRGRWC